MIHVFLIIFRELLETLITVGMLSSLFKEDIDNFTACMSYGCLIGISSCFILVYASPYLLFLFQGLEKEITSSVINLTTAVLIGFTVTWLPYQHDMVISRSQSPKDFSAQSRYYSLKRKFMFIGLVAFTILREGAEILLLVGGIVFSKNLSFYSTIMGILLGSATAALCGLLFYLGFVKVSKIFKWTSIIFTFIASGMAAEGLGILNRSGVINFLSQSAWNTSAIIPDSSLIGNFLKILVSYNSNPSILEVASFVTTFFIICSVNWLFKKKSKLNK